VLAYDIGITNASLLSMTESLKKIVLRRIRVLTGTFRLLLLTCLGLNGATDEKLPVLKVGTQVYSNVTITAVTATDIYFSYSKGVANAKLKNLDPALQKHFNFDPASAQTANSEKTGVSTGSTGPAEAGAEKKINRKDAQAIMDDAIARVKAIVNQPVRQLASTPDMEVSTYHPGWFHDGAAKPDFKTVDVRASQDTQYGRRAYVTSDLNPGVAFVGGELEFNPMTKYFYVDRSLPKKKLTEDEMLEVNRLYRIIGECEDKLQPSSALAMGFIAGHKNGLVGAVVGLGIVLLLIRVLSGRQGE